jgi:hypothetical protein
MQVVVEDNPEEELEEHSDRLVVDKLVVEQPVHLDLGIQVEQLALEDILVALAEVLVDNREQLEVLVVVEPLDRLELVDNQEQLPVLQVD